MYKDKPEKFFSENIIEIKNVIKFASNLIIFDKKTADSLETNQSLKLSSDYIDAYFSISSNLTKDQKIKIIDNYQELNPYYIKLKKDNNIEYAIARTSNDLTILKANFKCLSKEEEKLFYDCYYQALLYYKKILSTLAFSNQKNYRETEITFILFCTIQKYLTNKMEGFFNIDRYNKRDLKNSFISIGLDYFDNMPITYQRRLFKKINDIISEKGTNKCLKDIVSIFGFDNIKLYKYVLAKKFTRTKKNGNYLYLDPKLIFYKVESDKELNEENCETFDYDEITENDKYWNANKSELLNTDFNYLTSEYISVDSSINFLKESSYLEYFINLLYKAKNDNNIQELNFFNKKISNYPINIFDGFIAIFSLLLRSNGYDDNIIKNPDVLNYVYGFNDLDNKIDISKILNKIKNIIYNDNYYINLYNFINNNFKFNNINKNISIKEFINIFNNNIEIKNKLEEFINETTDYDLYKQLNLLWDLTMKSNINLKIFSKNDTYLDYLKNNNYDLYSFIIPNKNVNTEEKSFYFYRDCIFEICNSITSFIGKNDFTKALDNSPFFGLTFYLQHYIYTLVSLFKAYTTELLTTNFILKFNDKKDNTLKLFDKSRIGITDLYSERFDLLDNNSINIKEKFKDNISLKDDFKINVTD